MEGECGGPNALVKLTSHVTRDRTHRHNALRHVAGATSVPRSLTEAADDQVVQEFLRETASPQACAPSSFRMSSLLQEMREIERRGVARQPVMAPNVAHLAAEPAVWAEEFIPAQEDCVQQAGPQRLPTPQLVTHSLPVAAAVAAWGPQPGATRLAPRLPAVNPLDEVQWVEQYRPSEDIELQRTAEQILGTLDEPSFSGSEFTNFLAKIRDGEITLPDDTVTNQTAAASSAVAERTQDAAAADQTTHLKHTGLTDASEVAPEVDSAGMSPRAREEFWARLEREWADLYKSDEHPWLSDYTDHFSLQEYQFSGDNSHVDEADPLAEGERRRAAGDLPGAVLCFEAAAQRRPDRPLAWQLLGTSLAENEQDPAAIVALRKCIELDPSCLHAYMALAASYTNESFPLQACGALREWLRHHSEYSSLVQQSDQVPPASVFQPSVVTGDLHERVRDEFLSAARLRPDDPDPDVQCGLGVLLHMTGDYGRAVDCFNAALAVQPQSAQLWNKLGATLANGDRPEEAVAAYTRALQLWPGFIRARFNLGISCRSLNADREAAEHFLSALQHQAASADAGGHRSGAAMSQSIWSMLRITLAVLGRSDLLAAADSRDLTTLCRDFGLSGAEP